MNEDFFARYFDALDGEQPLSAMEMVADDAEFAILWAPGSERRCDQFLGGRRQLTEFTEAGDTSGWGHRILASAKVGDVELLLGETRTDQGEFIGTFVTAAELDSKGRMVRYIVGRTPEIRFSD
jgi:hypothetical protein